MTDSCTSARRHPWVDLLGAAPRSRPAADLGVAEAADPTFGDGDGARAALDRLDQANVAAAIRLACPRSWLRCAISLERSLVWLSCSPSSALSAETPLCAASSAAWAALKASSSSSTAAIFSLAWVSACSIERLCSRIAEFSACCSRQSCSVCRRASHFFSSAFLVSTLSSISRHSRLTASKRSWTSLRFRVSPLTVVLGPRLARPSCHAPCSPRRSGLRSTAIALGS